MLPNRKNKQSIMKKQKDKKLINQNLLEGKKNNFMIEIQ
jgi:hypothetical protein